MLYQLSYTRSLDFKIGDCGMLIQIQTSNLKSQITLVQGVGFEPT